MGVTSVHSPLRRIEELRGSSIAAVEASVALWPIEDRELLARLGLIDRSQDFSLTAAGRRVFGTPGGGGDEGREQPPVYRAPGDSSRGQRMDGYNG